MAVRAGSGLHVARIFDGQTLVDGRADEELLDLVLEPAECLRLDETRAYGGGRFDLAAAQPRLPQLDGRRTLRELDAADALPHLRELAALGFLEVRRARAAA